MVGRVFWMDDGTVKRYFCPISDELAEKWNAFDVSMTENGFVAVGVEVDDVEIDDIDEEAWEL